jgi:hypothetical protein
LAGSRGVFAAADLGLLEVLHQPIEQSADFEAGVVEFPPSQFVEVGLVQSVVKLRAQFAARTFGMTEEEDELLATPRSKPSAMFEGIDRLARRI